MMQEIGGGDGEPHPENHVPICVWDQESRLEIEAVRNQTRWIKSQNYS